MGCIMAGIAFSGILLPSRLLCLGQSGNYLQQIGIATTVNTMAGDKEGPQSVSMAPGG